MQSPSPVDMLLPLPLQLLLACLSPMANSSRAPFWQLGLPTPHWSWSVRAKCFAAAALSACLRVSMRCRTATATCAAEKFEAMVRVSREAMNMNMWYSRACGVNRVHGVSANSRTDIALLWCAAPAEAFGALNS